MDTERAKITAETWGIRGRGWLRLLLRLAGLALVIAGGVNLLVGVDGAVLPFELYRGLWVQYAGIAPWPLADALAIGVGGAIANFV